MAIKDTTKLAHQSLAQITTEGSELLQNVTLENADPLGNASVSGTVKSGGSGLANAVVKLYRVDNTSSAVTLVAHTAAFGTDGSYQIPNLSVVANNTYYVIASLDGYSTSSPSQVTLSETTPVTNANLTLTANGTSNRIYGTVSDQTPAAIANAVVMLILSNDGSLYAITQTNTDGEYNFSDVAAGTYIVNFSKTGYSNFNKSETVTGPIQTIKDDATLTTSTAATKGTVNGKITNGGSGVSATVFLYKVVSNVETLEASTVSASDGSYLFGNLDINTDYVVKAKISS